MPAGSFSQLYLRHIYPPGTQIIRRCCVCAFQPPTSLAELWQHARRMVLTPTFPSFFYPTRRPPPRGELPPKRETSTQNSTRGKTRKWLKWQRRSEDVHWHPPPTSSLHRFDFDFSLEESYQRRLDLSVKNSVSFMSRERELIGKVCVIRDKLIYSRKKSLKVTKTPCSWPNSCSWIWKK